MMFVDPIIATPAKQQSENVQFVAPVVDAPAQQQYASAPPPVNRLPVADNSNPSLDVSYQFAAPTTPSPKLIESVANSSLPEPDQIVHEEYVFSAPIVGVNDQSEEKMSVAPFVAPIVATSDEDDYISVFSSNVQGTSKCEGKANGSKMSIATCRRYYSECISGEAVPKFCPHPHEVFSAEAVGCVLKENAGECRKVVSQTVQSADEGGVQGKEFCSQRSNGFYRHPSNCSRILQCFDNEVFEYPPCDRNLAFDESKGVCDYREHVDNCADVPSSANAASSDSSESSAEGCGDSKHGDHVRNPQDCSTYFRCVWDRLVLMDCPEGTVFNPSLDVCDFPDQVEGCIV